MNKTTWLQTYMQGINKNIIKSTLLVITLILTTLSLSSGCDIDFLSDSNNDNNCDDALCIGLFSQQSERRSLLNFDAAEFARQDINNSDGNVVLLTGDVSDPLASRQEHERIAQRLLDRGADAIVGPESSQESLQVLEFFRDTNKQVAVVTPVAGSVALTEANMRIRERGGTPFFFRTVPNDRLQAQLLVSQTELSGGGDVLIVAQNDNYAIRLRRILRAELNNLNRENEIVTYDLFDLDDPDFEDKVAEVIADVESAVRTLGSDEITSIIVIVSAEEGGSIIKEMLDSPNIPGSDAVQYYVTNSLELANLHQLVDPNDPSTVEGFKGTTPCAISDPPRRITEFESRFGRDARLAGLQFAAQTYDAIVLIALAALSAEAESDDATPADYIDEMGNVSRDGIRCTSYRDCARYLTDDNQNNNNINYEGLSGPIDFDENGDIGSGCYAVYTHDATGGRTPELFSVPDLTPITP